MCGHARAVHIKWGPPSSSRRSLRACSHSLAVSRSSRRPPQERSPLRPRRPHHPSRPVPPRSPPTSCMSAITCRTPSARAASTMPRRTAHSLRSCRGGSMLLTPTQLRCFIRWPKPPRPSALRVGPARRRACREPTAGPTVSCAVPASAQARRPGSSTSGHGRMHGSRQMDASDGRPTIVEDARDGRFEGLGVSNSRFIQTWDRLANLATTSSTRTPRTHWLLAWCRAVGRSRRKRGHRGSSARCLGGFR
jgi:hypothetical protein